MGRFLAVAGVLALAGSAMAQNTGAILTDGTATYRLGGAGGPATTLPTVVTSSGPTTDLFLVGLTPENVFTDWWWYRTDNDTRENALANASARTTFGTNRVDYDYTMGNLRGTLSYTLTQPAAVSARVDQRWTIENPTGSPISLNLFHYIDFDLAGSGQNAATLTNPNDRMNVTHTGGTTADWWGVGAGAYQVTPFATLRGLLTNTAVNNLDNTGLPFATADFTGGFQWTMVIPANSQVSVMSSYGINTPAIPAPGAMALMALGGLVAARRRR